MSLPPFDKKELIELVQGALLVAQGMLEMLDSPWPDAVGGMSIGADPITAALITAAGVQGRELLGFMVRKEGIEPPQE